MDRPSLFWSIVQGTPIWVWPLLVVLVLIGLRATRTRSIPAIVFYFLPALGLITLRNVIHLPNPSLVWTVFAVTYFLGVLFGYRKQRVWLISRNGSRVTLKGEWFTLICILILFALNFVIGVVGAIMPNLYTDTGFLMAYTLVGGIVSGTFAGRAIRVWFS